MVALGRQIKEENAMKATNFKCEHFTNGAAACDDGARPCGVFGVQAK